MNKIILFKSDAVCHNFLNYSVELLKKSLEKYGVECFEIECVYDEFIR